MQVDRAWRLLCYFNLYVNLWPLWDSWKLFTLISPDPTFFPKWKVGVNLYVNLWSLWDSWKLFTLISPDPTFFFKWEVGVNVIDMPPDPESRSRVINYFLFALSLTLECLVRQLLNFNTSERNDTAPWRTTSLLTTVEVLPVFHSYSTLKKLFSLVFYSIDCIVESPLRFMASLSLYSSSYKTCKRKWYKHDAKKTVRKFRDFKSLKFKQTGVF